MFAKRFCGWLIILAVPCAAAALGIQGTELVWMDLDGDGYDDLMRFRSDGQAELLLNDTEGGFELANVIPGPGAVHDVARADLDGDGIRELLLATARGTFVIGVRDSAPRIEQRLPAARRIQLGDVNGDGTPELVLGSRLFRVGDDGAFDAVALPVSVVPGTGATASAAMPDGSADTHSVAEDDAEAAVVSSVPRSSGASGASPALEDESDPGTGAAVPPAGQEFAEGVGGDLVVGGNLLAHGGGTHFFDGNVGIGTSTASAELAVQRLEGGDAIARIHVINDDPTDVLGPAEIVFDRSAIPGGTQRAAVGVDETARDFYIWMNGTDRVRVDEAGVTRHLDDAGEAAVTIDPSGTAGAVDVHGLDGQPGLTLQGSEFGTDGAAIKAHSAAGTMTLELDGDDGGQGSAIYMKQANGNAALTLRAGESATTGAAISGRDAAATVMFDLDAEDTGGGASLRLKQAGGSSGLSFLANENAGNGATIYGYDSAGEMTFEVDGEGTDGGAYLTLHQGSAIPGVTAIANDGNGASLKGYDVDGDLTFTLDAEDADGGAELRLNSSDGGPGVQLEAQSATGGAYAYLFREDETPTVFIDSQDAADEGAAMTLSNAGGISTVAIDAQVGAEGAAVTLSDSDGTAGVLLDAQSATGGAYAYLFREDGAKSVFMDAQEAADQGGTIHLYDIDQFTTVKIDAQEGANEGADIKLNNFEGYTTIDLDADHAFSDGRIQLNTELGGTSIILQASESASERGAITLYGVDGQKSIWIEAQEGASQNGAIKLYGSDGNVSIEIDGDFEGAGRIITDELQITGGADLSEQFTVRTEVIPGSVLVIDPGAPGELTLSSRAYDSRVAGVVSGAGDVKPGVLMGHQDTAADGDVPVALTGRVYVWVDATEGAVMPGDLLTTAHRPGHAMKALDPDRAHGTTLGKALTGLDEGQGLVLALVSLQ